MPRWRWVPIPVRKHIDIRTLSPDPGVMPLTGTKLRENIYQVLDDVLESGQPVEILRKGRTLRIVPDPSDSRLSRLRKRPTLKSDPEELLDLDWSDTWTP